MTSKRLYFILLTLLVISLVGAAAAVYYGNSLLTARAGRLMSLKSESQVLGQQQLALLQAKQDIQRYSQLESIAKTVVPQEKDQARTVREIIALARASGVGIANIAFPSSLLGEQKNPAPAPAPADGAALAAPPPAAPLAAQPTAPPAALTQVEPVKGIAGLFQMDINVQGSNRPVPYESLLNFLSRLEQNRRTAQVINLSVQPATADRDQVTFSLMLRVYIKPR
jgi:hypothetical protein